jgi:hypothetical protein
VGTLSSETPHTPDPRKTDQDKVNNRQDQDISPSKKRNRRSKKKRGADAARRISVDQEQVNQQYQDTSHSKKRDPLSKEKREAARRNLEKKKAQLLILNEKKAQLLNF